MKTTIKFAIVFIIIVGVTLFISQCNSRQESNSTEKTETIDSASVDAEEPVDTSSIEKTKAIATQKPLTVIIENLESETAPVYISLYRTKDKFPEPKGQMKEYKFKAHGKTISVEIPNLKFGTYAIATYQDVNSSGKIDKNFIGIPTEGYAFSNNFKPTVKAPDFDDCSFVYNAKNCSQTIKMIR